jgi:hypothetical protein
MAAIPPAVCMQLWQLTGSVCELCTDQGRATPLHAIRVQVHDTTSSKTKHPRPLGEGLHSTKGGHTHAHSQHTSTIKKKEQPGPHTCSHPKSIAALPPHAHAAKLACSQCHASTTHHSCYRNWQIIHPTVSNVLHRHMTAETAGSTG